MYPERHGYCVRPGPKDERVVDTADVGRLFLTFFTFQSAHVLLFYSPSPVKFVMLSGSGCVWESADVQEEREQLQSSLERQ